MNEYQEQQVLEALEELDRLVPASEGRVKIVGGWPEKNRMEGDRAGFVRLGLMLLHAGIDAGPRKRELATDLFVSDSPIRFDELVVIERNRTARPSFEPDGEKDNTAKAAGMIVAFTVGVIVVATALCAVVYYFIHLGHK